MTVKFKNYIMYLTKWIVLISFFVNVNLHDARAQEDRESLLLRGSLPSGETKYSCLDVETFTVPAHLGDVRYFFRGSSDRFVIHLQDAHCNYFAQHKIAGILEYLNEEYGVNMINLEGGFEGYDLSAFTAITGREIRREVADYFVKKGEINGAEFYAINNPERVTLWGIEDKELYLKNLQVYRDSLEYKDQVDGFLKILTHILNNLKRYIYSPELLKIDMAYNAYKSGNMDFRGYLDFLIGKAKEKGIQVKNFSNLYLLFQAMETESEIDFKKANTERSTLVGELKNNLSQNEIRELVSKTVDFKVKKISRKVFYNFLLKKARQINLDIKWFPALSSYIIYVSLYEAVDMAKVMEELDGLENKIKEPLYRNDVQRWLNVLSRNLALMRNIFTILLTKVDYRYYLGNKDSFKIRGYQEFIGKEAPLYKIDTRPDSNISRLDDYRERITKFYEYSFKRDEVFLNNLRFSSAEGNLETAVLMTGGFHTENLCELFKQAGISYVSIMPKFEMEPGYESPYFDILAGQTTDLQRMLASSFAKASMLQVASKLSSLGEAVWGVKGIDSFKAAIYIVELITRSKREEGKDIRVALVEDNNTPVLDSKRNAVIFGEKGALLETVTVKGLLEIVNQREKESGQGMEKKSESESTVKIEPLIKEKAKTLSEIQVENAKQVIGDFRQDKTDIIVMPGSEMYVAYQEAVNRSSSRKLHKDYGQETLPYSYQYGDNWENNLKDLLEERIINAFDKSTGKGPRILLYLPITQEEKSSIFDEGKLLEDYASLKNSITIIRQTDIPEDGVIDNVMHIVLGKAFLNYERFRKNEDGTEAVFSQEARTRLVLFIKSLILNPDDIDIKKAPEVITKILDGVFALRMRPIDYTEIQDWKNAQDEVLRAL
ncbi:MAG: hypothetical protein ABH844_00900 [Candidatus Omnitrophota bacterium]